MTEQQREAIKQLLAEQADYHKTHPAEARAFLLSTGIYTADGKLAPAYDGEDTVPSGPG